MRLALKRGGRGWCNGRRDVRCRNHVRTSWRNRLRRSRRNCIRLSRRRRRLHGRGRGWLHGSHLAQVGCAFRGRHVAQRCGWGHVQLRRTFGRCWRRGWVCMDRSTQRRNSTRERGRFWMDVRRTVRRSSGKEGRQGLFHGDRRAQPSPIHNHHVGRRDRRSHRAMLTVGSVGLPNGNRWCSKVMARDTSRAHRASRSLSRPGSLPPRRRGGCCSQGARPFHGKHGCGGSGTRMWRDLGRRSGQHQSRGKRTCEQVRGNQARMWLDL